MKSTNSLTLPVPTPKGVFIARYSTRGLAGLEFPGTNSSLRGHPAPEVPAEVRRWHGLTAKALERALSGQSPDELPPLDFSSGTDFQRSVWTALRKITPGATRSYSEIAQSIGKPRAVRAVGGACGANPIPIFVPCHRVLAADGNAGGFSAGLNWKRTLLEGEGIRLLAGQRKAHGR